MSEPPMSLRPNDMIRSSSISEVQTADPDEALGLKEQWSDDDDDDDDDEGEGVDAGAARMKAHSDDEADDDSSMEDAGPGYFRLHDAIDTGDLEFVSSAILKTINIIGGGAPAGPEADTDMDGKPVAAEDNDDGSVADIDQIDDDGCTPLHTAILSGNIDILDKVLDAGADVTLACEGVPVVLVALCVGGLQQHRSFALKAIRSLVKFGSGVVGRDRLGKTALHVCAELNLHECAEWLLENGAIELLSVSDRDRFTPLHSAAFNGSLDVAVLLLGAITKGSTGDGANADVCAVIDKKERLGMTALHLCALVNQPSIAQVLVTGGANVSVLNESEQTAAILAEERKHEGVVAALAKEESGNGSAESKDMPSTLLLSHEICEKHYTCDPDITSKRLVNAERPSENVNRLTVLLNETNGALRSNRIGSNVKWANAPRANIADVLRVHEAAYIEKLQSFCAQLDEDEIGELDADTSISGASFEAAMHAAGAVCEGVDRVCQGSHRNVFCAVRPPGHHAGPTGVVTNERDPHGSYGFCLLSNAAIAASYARHMYRHQGVKRVAIIDFDVHHGNGTEACIRNLQPTMTSKTFQSTMCETTVKTHSYKPWLNEQDKDNIFFASVHGFGKRDPRMNANPRSFAQQGDFYPSSGEHCGFNGYVSEDDGEAGKRIVNYGQRSKDRLEWRASWCEHILPGLAAFEPDLIVISAGFDAHEKDEINFGYISIVESDYEWLTRELVRIGNSYSKGRVVSVLEGGYKIQGRLVSPFAQSVVSHVCAMTQTSPTDMWNHTRCLRELKIERELVKKAKEATAAAKGERGGETSTGNMDNATARTRHQPRRARAEVDYKALNDEVEAGLVRKRARIEEESTKTEGEKE